MNALRIVGDWGTSRLRLFRLSGGRLVDRAEGPGIGKLAGGSVGAALLDSLAPWRADGAVERVTLCGMVGSRNGLVEVPYLDCPASPPRWRDAAVEVALDGIRLSVLPGLATTTADRPDVMRGEETQLFGAMALGAIGPERRHVVLPGTHSKWAIVDDSEVLGFKTYLTGELFALLKERSTLMSAGTASGATDDDDSGFAHGVDRARTGGVMGGLFEARSAQLRNGRSAAWALGYLSGLLIGSEAVEATASSADDEPVTLIGDPALCARYGRALARLGKAFDIVDGDACVIAGLTMESDR